METESTEVPNVEEIQDCNQIKVKENEIETETENNISEENPTIEEPPRDSAQNDIKENTSEETLQHIEGKHKNFPDHKK